MKLKDLREKMELRIRENETLTERKKNNAIRFDADSTDYSALCQNAGQRFAT